jgi:23S rRNA (guanine745-N1)-methyltransferase
VAAVGVALHDPAGELRRRAANALHARLNPAEFRRVLRPGGRLLLALPAADDLIELRAAVLGEGREIERAERALRELEGRFRLLSRMRVAEQALLTHSEIEDALLATYRGARMRERERLEGLHGLDVTLSADVLELAPC